MTDYSFSFKVYTDKTVLINGEESIVTGFGETHAEPKRCGLGALTRSYIVDHFPWPLVCFFEDENIAYNKYFVNYKGWGIAKNKNFKGSYICYYPALEEPPVIDTLEQHW